jgi:myxalamid-type polyketide synthase MxaE and MxaD
MSELDAWWVVPTPKPAARMRLFCLPYAGGSATAFHRFAQGFADDVEVQSLQPPGRGFRLREPAMTDLGQLLDKLSEVIEPRLDRPFALLGHSFGALLAFELVRALRRRGRPLPMHLFASAAAAPAAWSALRVALEQPAERFWSDINALYGTPISGPVHPDVLALAVPPLKTDCALIASYRYVPEEKLALPITTFVGASDPMVKHADAEGWQHETTGRFALHEVPGAHLFLQESAAVLSVQVRAALG